MKKVLYTIIFLSLALVANASDSFMEKALSSWLNYPLDNVINSWGFPDEEKVIANRHIFIWKKAWSQYIPQYTTSDLTPGFYSTTVHSRTSGGYSINYYCQRTLEVNSKNEIIFGEWKGNACPASYKKGKNLVNPENDEVSIEFSQLDDIGKLGESIELDSGEPICKLIFNNIDGLENLINILELLKKRVYRNNHFYEKMLP